MTKKRVFISLALPPKIKEAILHLKEKEPFFKIRARFTKKENLHITLLFLGSLEVEKLSLLASKVEKVVKKFSKREEKEVFLNKVCFGPPFKPRMIWVTGESKILEEIAFDLKEELKKAGLPFKNKERKFLLHITLARFEKGYQLASELKNFFLKVGWRFPLKKIQIQESILRAGRQPLYLPLKEFLI